MIAKYKNNSLFCLSGEILLLQQYCRRMTRGGINRSGVVLN